MDVCGRVGPGNIRVELDDPVVDPDACKLPSVDVENPTA